MISGRHPSTSEHNQRPLPRPTMPRFLKRPPSTAAVGACAVPMPLGPLHTAVLGLGEHFGPDIGDLAKQRCPVPPYLVGPVKFSPGVGRLHAVVVVVETGHEGVDVVGVNCCA